MMLSFSSFVIRTIPPTKLYATGSKARKVSAQHQANTSTGPAASSPRTGKKLSKSAPLLLRHQVVLHQATISQVLAWHPKQPAWYFGQRLPRLHPGGHGPQQPLPPSLELWTNLIFRSVPQLDQTVNKGTAVTTCIPTSVVYNSSELLASGKVITCRNWSNSNKGAAAGTVFSKNSWKSHGIRFFSCREWPRKTVLPLKQIVLFCIETNLDLITKRNHHQP